MHNISEIAGMYSSLSEIISELESRWNNTELRKKVELFLQDHGFPFPNDLPHAFFSRSVVTPNLETLYFLDLAKDVDLPPLFLEYPDKLVTKNQDKMHLCKLFFYTDHKREDKRAEMKIVDVDKYQGKKLDKVMTNWNERLIDFHHNLLYMHDPSLNGKIIDIYGWFNRTRDTQGHYYLCYLSLFICHGVLFENFLEDDKEETLFVKNKILPSFIKASEIFGVKPLIFPLLPVEYEKYTSWLSYPISIRQEVLKYLKSKT